MAIANVTLSNTFDQWRIRHNIITLNINDLQNSNEGLNVAAANTVYGFIKFAAGVGSENAPSITSIDDPGSGVYFPSNGQMAFSTNNVQSLIFNANREATFSNNVSVVGNLTAENGTINQNLNVSGNTSVVGILDIGTLKFNPSANGITSIEYNSNLAGGNQSIPTTPAIKNYVDNNIYSGLTTSSSGTSVTTYTTEINFVDGFSITGNGSTATVNSVAKRWRTETSNYTASHGDRILADTITSSFTITLPASPNDGDVVIISDPDTSWGTNALTVNGNGNSIDGSASVTLETDNDLKRYVYSIGKGQWVTANSLGSAGGATSSLAYFYGVTL